MLNRLFRHRASEDAARRSYAAIVETARAQVFYERLAVDDTVEGRFEMIMLVTGLVTNRLSGAAATQSFARRVSELFFTDMDRNLREMGVGDLGVGKRMQKIAGAFFGRAEAYKAAQDAGGRERLADALRRNVYAGRADAPADALAEAVEAMARDLAASSDTDLLAGGLPFRVPLEAEAAQ